ncbi:YbjN domain-containing protein [Brenneria izadpanahii]|uniref:YbjN domain-containing protein n=1 Tax=Brenneria izadpanahii TaxID=2722756 RepID=A0ABX7UYS2_9GAMM|nr:YbjN domain-containing protein [Brenneria izadpanahii]QTF08704.1 YbjN domain-containing protein [Brenneria izadpanahii]
MKEQELIKSVNVASLTENLQSMGYRVTPSEQNGIVQLLSASQGMGFSVRFGNSAPEADAWLDFTFGCVLRIEGELPEAMTAQWNRSKRFSRLSEQEHFLALEMDCLVAGGVSGGFIRANIEIWDRLMQEFLLYLRTYRQVSAEETTLGSADAAPKTAGLTGDKAQSPAASVEQDIALEQEIELKA